MRAKILAIFLLCCLLGIAFTTVKAQEAEEFQVTFTFDYGGLLWVNGTAIANNTVTAYPNGTILSLAATPTNANYSYAYMLLNGTQTFDNPASLNMTSEFENSTFTASAFFVAEVIPTPSPSPSPSPVPELTVEDTGALAFFAIVCAVALPCAFLLIKKSS